MHLLIDFLAKMVHGRCLSYLELRVPVDSVLGHGIGEGKLGIFMSKLEFGIESVGS